MTDDCDDGYMKTYSIDSPGKYDADCDVVNMDVMLSNINDSTGGYMIFMDDG